MPSFKSQLLNHFKQLKPALERVGADAFLNVRSFMLEVRFRGRMHAFHPQFLYFDKQGARRFTSEFRSDVFRFVGWCPYFSKRWTLAIEKLRLKEYAAKNGLRTPPWWVDPDADVPDVVVKRNCPGGAGTRGPYRSSREARLDVRDGEYYERFIPGTIVKIWFWDGRPVCCELHDYGSICGDGKRSVRELVGRQGRKREKKLALEHIGQFLAYQGRSLDGTLALDEVLPVDFRYGSGLSFRSAVKDVDLRRDPIPGTEAQLKEMGSCLLRGIPEGIRANTVFTVDAVLDAQQTIWLLAMDSNPFLHPHVYAPMIESWAKDPESSLRQIYGTSQEASAEGGVGLH